VIADKNSVKEMATGLICLAAEMRHKPRLGVHGTSADDRKVFDRCKASVC
jgi:hypothetical protein